jgi:hypothetical protein
MWRNVLNWFPFLNRTPHSSSNSLDKSKENEQTLDSLEQMESNENPSTPPENIGLYLPNEELPKTNAVSNAEPVQHWSPEDMESDTPLYEEPIKEEPVASLEVKVEDVSEETKETKVVDDASESIEPPKEEQEDPREEVAQMEQEDQKDEEMPKESSLEVDTDLPSEEAQSTPEDAQSSPEVTPSLIVDPVTEL